MARPTDWHNLDLHQDPTPGEPYDIKDLGSHFRTFGNDVESAHSRLSGVEKDAVIQEWTGLAAHEFRGQIGGLPGQLEKLRDSYRKAGDALVKLAEELEHVQSSADGALVKARSLRGDLSRAQSDLASAKDTAKRAEDAKDKLDNPKGGDVPPPDPDQVRQAARNATQAGQAQDRLESQVAGLQQQLADLRRTAEKAGSDRDRAADTATRELNEASDAGIQNKKWYEKVGDWLAKAWDNLVVIAKIVVAIGGIILLFVGGPILVLIVLAAALIVLADTIKKFAEGKAGWGDLLFAVLDCVPVVGKLAMLAKAGKFLSKAGLALKVAKAEKALGPAIRVWRAGGNLKGFNKVAFAFGKGLGKDTLKDAMNGGWDKVQANFVKNVVGNAIGTGGGELVKKGFTKLPGAVYGDVADMTAAQRREFGQMSMDFNEKTDLGKGVVGATSGLVTGITKEIANDAFFDSPLKETDGKTNHENVLLSGLRGAANGGVTYTPGLSGAR